MAAGSQLVGHTLGHYRIIEQIGAGGMGVVYRARDEQLERDVALKVLPPGSLIDEAAHKRFRKEALALAKLNHPNVATVYEFGSQQGTDFLVTEYIPGLTLDTKLAAAALPENEVVGLGAQLAQGLRAAHEQGIVHRDLKPANLRLTSDGRLKILDFGLAQLAPHASELGMTATLTQSQEVSGTLPYMAPEQLRGEPAEAHTDIWAAGAVLYEMATAHRPFQEKVPMALAVDILHKSPPSPRSLQPTLSPKLEAVILKCLEKDPTKRYQSARELQSDLERLSTGAVPQAARHRLWPVMVSVPAAVLLAAAAFLYLHPSPKLTERDTIVLADFTNATGDPVFDDTLKTALSVSLNQSPFLNVLPENKIAATLKLMTRPPDTKLTPDVARELCQRAGSKAYIAGSIASLGSQYVLGFKVVNCQNGDPLAQEQVTATSKEEVLAALSKAAAELRGELGESLASVKKFDVSIEVTTSSLEAFRNFSMSIAVFRDKGNAPSIPFLKRATELDPDFPMAYAGLAAVYGNLGQPSLALENATKAYQLRDRVTEREKLRITAEYFDARGEVEKEAQTYELWKAYYPRDSSPYRNLGVNYADMGQYDKALEEEREALRIEPNDVGIYANVGGIYLYLNRLQEAKDTFDQALAHRLDSGSLRVKMYYLAFLWEDVSQMKHQVAWGTAKPDKAPLLSAQSDTEAYYGGLSKARDFSRRAVDSAVRADSKEGAAYWQVNAALREAEVGNIASARKGVRAALALSPGPDVKEMAALTLACAGHAVEAEGMAEELEKSYPTDTFLRLYWLPTIKSSHQLH